MIDITDKKEDVIVGSLGDRSVKWGVIHTEKLNLEETLSFTMLANHPKATHIVDRNRLLIPSEDKKYMHEFIIENTDKSTYEIDVTAVGSHYDLEKAGVIEPQQLTGATPKTALGFVVNDTEWQVGEVEFADAQTIYFSDYIDKRAAIKQVAREFGLELRFRVITKANRIIGRYVDAFKKRGKVTNKEVRIGKDMTDISRVSDSKEVVTALVAVTPEKEDGTRFNEFVSNATALRMWGRRGRHLIELYQPESDRPDMTQEELRGYANTELKKRIAAQVQYDVSAVTLESITGLQHERVGLGDSIRVIDEEFEPSLFLDARVIGIQRDPDNPQEKTYTLGEFVERREEDLRAFTQMLLRKIAQKAGKVLFDGEDQVGELGADSSFGYLYVGDFASPTIPMKSQADMKFYVSDRVIDDGLEPDDSNSGQSFAEPLRTVAEAVRRIPETLNHEARIILAYGGDFYEYIRCDGFTGSGKIIINGQYKWGTTLHNGLRFTGSTVPIEVREMLIISESTYEVFSTNAGKTEFIDCVFKGKQSGSETTTHGIVCYDQGNVRATNCHFYDMKHAMYAYDFGRIVNIDNKGNATRYGLQARTGGRITGYGTAPSGNIANKMALEGGFVDDGNLTYDPSVDESEPTTGTVTKQWTVTDSGTWTSDYGGTWDSVIGSDVTQGEDGRLGPYWGAWLFGSGPSNEVTGKTIKQIRIKAKRRDRSGAGSAVPIQFRMHSYTSKPSSQPGFSGSYHSASFRRNEEKWVTLPKSFHVDFESGSRKGIGIYSSTGAYTKMAGGATLEITYEG